MTPEDLKYAAALVADLRTLGQPYSARVVEQLLAERSLLQGALETIDCIAALAAEGSRSPGDMEEIDEIIQSFRKAYPNSHSETTKDENKSRPDVSC